MTDSGPRPDSAAVQFMIVDFLGEILKFSASPAEMGQHLARLLRELVGVRIVALLEHDGDPSEGSVRIVAIEPVKAHTPALTGTLARIIGEQAHLSVSTLVLRGSAAPQVAEAMDRIGVESLSLTPLRVGELRVGTLAVLSYLDQDHLHSAEALLDALSPVFALILRNALHYESQEAKVVAQAEEYRTFLETNLDGFLLVSGQGAILDANDAYLRMSGYSRPEVRGLPIARLEAVESFADATGHIERIKARGSDRFLSAHRRKDGSSYPVEVSTTHVPNRDVFVSFVRDLSELKRAEEESARLQCQLQQSQKMESLGVLAGGVAHDMNNVLGAILGMATASIESHAPGSATYQALDTIIRAAERGGKMVKGLLGFARQTSAESQVLDLNTVIRDEVQLLAHTTLSRVALVPDLDPDLKPVLGEASALANAFMNLCVNAVDAMSDRGTLTLRTRNVDNGWVEVLVEDTGSGMTKDVLDRAMDPFFTTKGSGRGTGLGLTMVYSTIKAHRGRMDIESRPGQGTRVRLRFPACAPELQASGKEPKAPRDTGQASLDVLLVDDDDLVQCATQALLEALGHRVALASSGEEALAKIMGGMSPSVVILDMNMPGLGGAGTLPRLRATHPAVPVLLATGRVDQCAVDLSRAHANVQLLSKPFTLGELKRHLQALPQVPGSATQDRAGLDA